MDKKNDMVLNMLANQDFQVRDFQAVGLKADNTNLRSEEEYLQSDKITKNPLFQDANGQFDKGLFHEFYIGAAQMYNQLSQEDYHKTILEDAKFSEDNIWVEPKQRKISYAPKLVREPNERLVTSSLDEVGKKGQRTRSTSEIAQTQQVYNTETGQWEDSPNDSFFGHFLDTLVLATYDEDVYDDNGKKIHSKGEQKYNDEGLPYYETLGGRNPSQKQVLNKLNVITKDGSALNKFDFFDADDIEQKSIGGTLLRNAALVGSMFIPYVGPAVIATSVLTQVAGLGATLGKVLTGSNSPTLNNIQGWAKSVNRQAQTEYAAENTWCVENFLNMIGDTVGQLAEQRWIFKAVPALMQGSLKPYKAMSSKGREKLIAETMKDMEKTGSGASVEKLMENLKNEGKFEKFFDGTLKMQAERLQDVNRSLAVAKVDALIDKSTKIGSPIAKAYMTGITVQDTYDEAKNAGASDLEAALLTIGYAAAEAKLLNSELGEWIMPELHGERFRNRAVAQAMVKNIKGSMNIAKGESAATRVGLAKSLINKGKAWFNHDYSQALYTGGKTLNVVGAHALGESFEEVSEEALADFSKSVFNVTRWLRGKESLDMGQWDNMLDRYGMSALGGFFGGGINSAATDFVTSKNLNNMSQTQALQELIYMVNNGTEGKFLDEVDKMTLGDKNLSAEDVVYEHRGDDGKVVTINGEARKAEDSQDYQIKQMVRNQVGMIKNLLESEGARVSTESLISTLTLENQQQVMKDLRLGGLRNASTLGLYLQNFQSLQEELLRTKAEVLRLESLKPDSGEDPQMIKDAIMKANQKLLELRTKKDAYLTGKISGQFIRDALFEMNPILSNFAIKANEVNFLETIYGKKLDEMSESELEEGRKAFEEYSKTGMKNDIHSTAQLFANLLETASPVVLQQHQYAQQVAQQSQGLLQAQNFIQRILGQMDHLSETHDVDSTLGQVSSALADFDMQAMQTASSPLLSDTVKQQLQNILTQIDTPIDGETPQETQQRLSRLSMDYRSILYNSIAENVDSIMQPIANQTFLNPEVKNSLTKSLDFLYNYYNGRAMSLFPIANDAKLSGDPNAQTLLDQVDQFQEYARKFKDYLDNLKTKSNTPIIEFLTQYQKNSTNSDVDLMKHWDTTMGIFADAKTSDGVDASEIIVSDEWVEDNLEVQKLLDSFEAVIQGMRVDNGDFDNPTGYTRILNQINPKIGNTDYEQLAEIDAAFADMVLQDVHMLQKRFKVAEELSAINRGQKLKQQEKVATRKNFLLYKSLSHLSDVVPPDDWEEESIAKLQSAIQSADFLSSNYDRDTLQFSKEEREKAEEEMLNIEDAIYDFFEANKVNGKLDSKKVGRLLYAIAGDAGFFAENDDLLTENSTSIDSNSFIWWIAARAALKGSDFYGAYRQSLSDDKAPIASQELATYLGVAAYTNMDMLNSFVDAYRDTVITEFNKKSEEDRKKLLKEGDGDGYATTLLKYFGGHDVLPQYRNMIFIEGAPGTGKSKGVFSNIKRIIANIDPDIESKSWYIHATDESAQEAATDLGLTGLALGREKFLQKLSTGHKTAIEQEDEVPHASDPSKKVKVKRLHLVDGTYSFNSEGQLVNTEKLNDYSTDELPKVIFIDEISHYNEQELSLIEQFARKNGIIVMTAGDLQQNTQEAFAKIAESPEPVNVSISRNKFIRTPKLGVSLRSRNKTIEDAMAAMQTAFRMTKKGGHEIHFQYTDNDLNHPGLYGVKVIQSTDEHDVSDDKIEEAKQTIDLMMSTLKDGQKLGYIWDGKTKSKLYQYVDSKYHDRVDFKKGSDAQGLEGQYYVVENDRTTGTSMSRNNEYLRSLYTGISRAEQGVLVIANGSGSIGNVGVVSSTKAKELQLLDLGATAIQRASEIRRQQLDNILDGRTINTLQINRPTIQAPVAPITSPSTPPPSLPPVLPPTPVTPRRIGTGWTDRNEIQAIVDRLSSRITPETKVKELSTDTEYSIKGLSLREDTSDDTPIFIPTITIEDSSGAEYIVDLENFKTNYTLFTQNSVIPIYNVGDTITINNGAGTANVEITALDVTDPSDPKYTLKNIETDAEQIISQNDLQAIYQGLYNPTVTPPPTETPTTGLENLQGGEYEAIVAEANVEEEPERAFDDHIDHVLYTFTSFETGMKRDNNGKAIFDNPTNDPIIAKKQDQRIDNMIGLSRLLGSDNYDEMLSILGALKNIIMNTEDKSIIVDKVRKLINARITPTGNATEDAKLGMKGNIGVSFALKSIGKRTATNGIYDRFDLSDDERIEYIHSDDLPRAEKVYRKHLVAIFDADGDNVLEVSLGQLNSPITLLMTPDGQGGKLYQDAYNDFMAELSKPNSNIYTALQTIIPKYQSKYGDLMDLAKLWLYTSNGIFYLDDDFSLAKYSSNGPELSKRKGQKQLNGRYGFDGSFIDIGEFAKNPQHHVSSVMMVTDDSLNGQKVPGLHAGHSFVLVTDNDNYRRGGDKALVDRYVAQVLDPSLKKEVKLFYVVPPTATVGDWLRNLHTIGTNKLPESSPYRTTETVYDIGNDFTAFRILEAMIDNGTFDGFNSSLAIKDEVKQAVQTLKDIEGKWNETSLNLDHSKFIEGRPEDDYFQWFLDNGYSEKEARDYMKIREQRQYLNSKNTWGKASLPADRTISQALSSYLTNIVWQARPDGTMNEDIDDINNTIQKIEQAVAGKIDQIYFKAQYSDDTVSGNFVRVKVSNDWTIGRTPSGNNAQFKINAKIDTPTFLLTDFSDAIRNIVSQIYYDPVRKVWTSQIGYKKANEDRYLVKARNNQTLGQRVSSKYSVYLDHLDPDILADDSFTSEHDMLIALANKYNQQPGRYGFVRNGRLYLTTSNIKLDNPDVEIDATNDTITFKNAVDLNTNELVDVDLSFVTDPTTSQVTKIESRTTRFKLIDIGLGNSIQINDADIPIFQQSFESWRTSPTGRRAVTTFNPDFSSPENFKTSILNWMNNTAGAKRALLTIRRGLESMNVDQSVINLLQSLIDYDGTVTQINLQPGDTIVSPNNIRYIVDNIQGTVVTATNLDDNTQSTLDVENFKKEEFECAPTLWNII